MKLIFVVLLLSFASLPLFSQNVKKIPPKFPFVNSNIDKFYDIPRDDDNIPMLEIDGKKFYYPVQYTQIALHYYANFLKTGNPKISDEFIKFANFIKENITHYPNFAVWECNEEIKGYKLNPPWGSSMAQGFGIGVLLEAYKLTKDKEFLKTAKKAVRAYEVDIINKGVQNDWDGYKFYEEYADQNSHVLNGYIFSLAGLYYFYKLTGDSKSKELFNVGIESLKAKIHEFDADFTSYYGKLHYGGYQYASAINEDPDHYHELVIYQLLTLYVWTKEIIFFEFAQKFLQYDTGQVTDFYEQDKFQNIIASYTIDPVNHGVDKLDDELWSWGKYWSTNKFPTELIIDFGEEKKGISQIVFYSISNSTLPEQFDVYIYNSNYVWEKVLNANDVNYSYLRTYKTGNYETFIKGYPIEKKLNGTKLKVKFLGNSKNLITLREINVHYNRSKELEFILKLAQREKIIVE